jgi:lysophospholipase L1-like esterase
LNGWLQNLCLQKGYTFLNYFKDLADQQGQMGADLADDGLHPNSKGYRIMAPLALAAVDKTVVTHTVISAAPVIPKKGSK